MSRSTPLAISLVILAFIAALFAPPVFAQESGPMARYAVYAITGAKEHDKPVAVRVELDGSLRVREGGELWEMRVHLRDGRTLGVGAVSQRTPMMSPDGPGVFLHYGFRTAEGKGYEYINIRTGRAILPRFDFVNQFLPTSSKDAVFVNGFAASGRFMGHTATLEETGTRPAPPPWKDRTLIRLRPDLMIGTSRTVRDDGTGKKKNGDYTYVPFTEADYDEMIAAGINYFGVTDDQLPYVRDRAVYWRHAPVFPDDFYRSNYVGVRMFTDEPMVRMGWQGVLAEDLIHPHQVTNALTTRVAAMYADGGARYGVEDAVKKQGIDLGTMRLVQDDVPTWETVYESAFYELAGGSPGIVHEGRYVMPEGYGWHPSSILGPGLEVTPDEMLRCYYGFLRGAARAFGGDWGTAIYGQSDPAIRQEALNLAWSMGAKYCWFWTSDHDHHVPYTDQLALTRGLVEHWNANPKRGPEADQTAPRTAIAFPPGYSVSWGELWGQRAFENERLTRKGAFYREVAATGLWEGILCAKQGVSFDFTVDHEGLDDLGYDRIIRIGEDASVNVQPPPLETQIPHLEVTAGAGPGRAVDVPAEATETVKAACLIGRGIEIDGSLADWPETKGFVLSGPPVDATGWDDPADLSGEVLFGYDTGWLYVGAAVRDDVQNQSHHGWSLWKGDSVQIGFDPLNERTPGNYGPNMHEIGLALEGSRPVCWRWVGRRGQPREEMTSVRLAIVRDDEAGTTTYEAAIPLAELQPLLPEVFGMAGAAVVLNDADTKDRESYLESSPGALTAGKHPDRFASLVFEPPSRRTKESAGPVRQWAGMVWHNTVMPEGGVIDLDVYSRAWDADSGKVAVRVTPAGSSRGYPGASETAFAIETDPDVRTLTVAPGVPAGQYRLKVEVLSETGRVAAEDSAPLYVYPE